MFRKLWEKAEAANYRAAAKRDSLACPQCRAKPASAPKIPRQVITCASCGTRASAFEWSVIGADVVAIANADKPPALTRIIRSVDASGAVTWRIPASGKSGGLFFFGIFWCSITALLSGAFLFGDFESKSNDGFPMGIFLVLFFGVFWSIGMLYAACRSKYAVHQLTIDPYNITLRRELFGRSKDKTLPTAGIKSISQIEFYQKNYQPVHGIEVKGATGKLRFGSMLTDDEKAWLVADMKRLVFATPAASTTAPDPSPIVTRVRQSYFSVPVPKTSNSMWPLAILLVLIGTAFVCIGIFLIEPMPGFNEQGTPTFVRVFDFIFNFITGGFRIIWTTMSGAMVLGGLLLAFRLNRSKHQETRIEGTDSEIAVRTTRHGRVLKEEVYPRQSVSDIRAVTSGAMNSKTMKQIELLVGDRAEPVSTWVDGEKADELVSEIRGML